MSKRSFSLKSILNRKALKRYLNLKLLKLILRPTSKIEDLDSIQSSEIEFENANALLFKKYLNFTGIHSIQLETSFGQMHYYDTLPNSQITPLVFIHGLGSSAQSFWILAKMLKNKRRIVILDLFHMSGFSKANNSAMDFISHAQSVVELLKTLTSHPVDVCGLSLGGWLGMHISATHPTLVNKLILLNPGGIRINPFGLRDTLTHLNWKKFSSLYPGILKAFPYTGIPLFSKKAKRTLYLNLKKSGVKNFLRTTQKEHFVDEILHKIQCPVLLLWGKEDKFLSSKSAEVILQNIKNIEAKWVENCAHVLSLEAPGICFSEINNFLKLNPIKNNFFTKVVLSCSYAYQIKTIKIHELDNDH